MPREAPNLESAGLRADGTCPACEHPAAGRHRGGCYYCEAAGCGRRHWGDADDFNDTFHTACLHCVEHCACERDDDYADGARDIGGVRHVTHPLQFWPSTERVQFKQNPSKRFIAAEVEVYGVRARSTAIRNVIDRWSMSVVGDGSLPTTGFEVNTSPANGDQYILQITELGAALKAQRAYANGACGLHIHTDARDLAWWDIRRVILLYEKVEPALFAMVPESRRISTYAVPCGTVLADAVRDGKTPKEMKQALLMEMYNSTDTREQRGWMNKAHNKRSRLHSAACRKWQRHHTGVEPDCSCGRQRAGHGRGHKYSDTRYSAFNLHSWIYRGTIEWRLPPGTTQVTKIVNWGMLFAGIVDTAVRLPESKIVSLNGPANDVLKLCTVGMPALPAWIDERIEQYGPGVQEIEAA